MNHKNPVWQVLTPATGVRVVFAMLVMSSFEGVRGDDGGILRKAIPERLIALTFDDGCASHARPAPQEPKNTLDRVRLNQESVPPLLALAIVALPAAAAAESVPMIPEGLEEVEQGSMTIGSNETADAGAVPAADGRWPGDKAWKWYRSRPWPCGFNYIPANAISYTEMWMPYNFDAKLIDKELALAEGVGFNCLRVVLPFVVWEHDPAAFKKRLRTFLSVCDKRGIKVMPCLFDDCAFGSEERLRDPWYGKQPEVLEGWYANGWTPSPGHSLMREPEQWPRLERYVTDLVGSFKNDKRVWVWDLYNEPTNGRLGNVSVPLVEKVFGWARRAGPTQPLTVAEWNNNATLNDVIHRHSDIVTFHSYRDAESLSKHIASLKKHKRPIINTEWLNRGHQSLVATCLPVFARKNVGCMHWGLVNGRTQTDLNWGHRPGQPEPAVWQHDLFHGNHNPYDVQELELFRRTIRQRAR